MSANKPVWEIPDLRRRQSREPRCGGRRRSTRDAAARRSRGAGVRAARPRRRIPASSCPSRPTARRLRVPARSRGRRPGSPRCLRAQASVPVAAAPAAPAVVEVTAVPQSRRSRPPSSPPAAPAPVPAIDAVPQPGDSAPPAPVRRCHRARPAQRPEYRNADPDVIAALQQVLFTGASDLHVTANAAPMLRVDGGLSPVAGASVWNADKVRSALVLPAVERPARPLRGAPRARPGVHPVGQRPIPREHVPAARRDRCGLPSHPDHHQDARAARRARLGRPLRHAAARSGARHRARPVPASRRPSPRSSTW